MRLLLVIIAVGVFSASGTLAQEKAKSILDHDGIPLPNGAIARLGTTRFHVDVADLEIALSPDSRHIVKTRRSDSSLMSTIEQIDATTGMVTKTISVCKQSIFRVQCSSDNKHVFCFSQAGIYQVNLSSAKVQLLLDKGGYATLNHDGTLAATMSDDDNTKTSSITITDCLTQKELQKINILGRIKLVRFSPDSKQLICNVDIMSQKLMRQINSPPYDRHICIYQRNNSVLLHTYECPVNTEMIVNDQGTKLLQLDNRTNSSQFVDIASGKSLNTKLINIKEAAFLPNSDDLLIVDNQNRVNLFNGTTQKTSFINKLSRSDKCRIILSPVMSNRVLLLHGDFQLFSLTRSNFHGYFDHYELIDLQTNSIISKPNSHHGLIYTIYQNNTNTLISIGTDQTIRQWDLKTNQQQAILYESASTITSTAMSPDGAFLAIADRSSKIKLLRLMDKQTIQLNTNFNSITKLAFTNDGLRLHIAGLGRDAYQIWDVKQQKVLTSRIARQDFTCLNISTHAQYATWQQSNSATNGELNRQLFLQATADSPISVDSEAVQLMNNPYSIAITEMSPSGYLMVASTAEEKRYGIRPYSNSEGLSLWESSSGQFIRMINRSCPRTIAFSPNNRRIALSGNTNQVQVFSEQNSVRDTELWDVIHGTKESTLPVTSSALQFSSCGKYLYTGDIHGTILIWPLPVKQHPKATTTFNQMDEERWWINLSMDAELAYLAIQQMVTVPTQTVQMVKQRMKPIPPLEPNGISALIRQLDDSRYAVRERATKQLMDLQEIPIPDLLNVMNGKLSLEAKTRVELILKNFATRKGGGSLQRRVVYCLEQIGTPQAITLLEEWSTSEKRSCLAIESIAALTRLKRLKHQ